ncbi:MAG TPA: Ion transporter [Ruminococcaceae bacterium]|nr:Ion transporter [Oscillospiraceae bacterium]
MKKRIFDIIQIGNKGELASRLFDYLIVCAIFINILVAFLDTFEQLSMCFTLFTCLEAVTIILFIIEYILRVWTADLLYPDKSPGRARLKFMFSFDGIVDLLTILPFFFLDGMVIFRMLRVVRIFHLFRINSQYDSFNLIKEVLIEKRKQLFSSLFLIIILVLASSLAMYGAEHDAQPEAFENAFSGIWWSVSTLLTVGYGDIYPVTVAGRIIAIFIAFLGVCAVAVPTGIISAGFVEKFSKSEHSDRKFHDIREVGEILCDSKCGLIGLKTDDIYNSYGIRVYMIIRGELTVVPNDLVTINENDILIVNSEKLLKKNEKKPGKKKK